MKTTSANANTVKGEWFVIDAEDAVLGRLAAEVSHLLRGKHKPDFTPHVDMADHVVVINAEKIRTTGNKLKNKTYYRHTGYPGGIKSDSLETMLNKHPERVIEKAVKGMLPRTVLGREMFRKLKVYAGTEHPHSAQEPKEYKLKGGR